jgi:hypothetical protein
LKVIKNKEEGVWLFNLLKRLKSQNICLSEFTSGDLVKKHKCPKR